MYKISIRDLLAKSMYKLPKRGLLARSLRKVCIKDLIEIYAQDLLDYENGHRTTARLGQLESQLIPRAFRSRDGSCLWVLDWSMLFAFLNMGRADWLGLIMTSLSAHSTRNRLDSEANYIHVQFKIFVPSLTGNWKHPLVNKDSMGNPRDCTKWWFLQFYFA